jgi:hypothetical protein
VADEVATDSGDHQHYTLAHTPIDAYHGKITFEDQLRDAQDYRYRVTVKVDGLSSSLPWVLFGRFGRALAFVDTALYPFGLAALTTLNALLARSYTTGSAAPANIWFSACRGPRSPHTALLATPFTMAIA